MYRRMYLISCSTNIALNNVHVFLSKPLRLSSDKKHGICCVSFDVDVTNATSILHYDATTSDASERYYDRNMSRDAR